eukprot:2284265-Pleurochrysis_carterae.AAC.3
MGSRAKNKPVFPFPHRHRQSNHPLSGTFDGFSRQEQARFLLPTSSSPVESSSVRYIRWVFAPRTSPFPPSQIVVASRIILYSVHLMGSRAKNKPVSCTARTHTGQLAPPPYLCLQVAYLLLYRSTASSLPCNWSTTKTPWLARPCTSCFVLLALALPLALALIACHHPVNSPISSYPNSAFAFVQQLPSPLPLSRSRRTLLSSPRDVFATAAAQPVHCCRAA